MSITFACECGKQLRTGDENAGKRVKCPSCGQAVAVPAASRAAAKGPDAPPPVKEAAPELVRFRCDCGKQLQAKSALAGRRVKCPGCGAELLVPGGADAIQATKPAAKKPAPAPGSSPRRKAARDEDPLRFGDEDEGPPEREDGEEEERPRRDKRKAKKGLPLPVLLGISAAALLVVVGGGVGAYLLFLKEDPKPPPIPGRPPVVQNNPQGQPVQLGPDLELVQRDAVGFASVRVGQLWNSPALQSVKPMVAMLTGGMLPEMEKKIGLSLADVDRATMVWLAPDSNEVYLIVSTSKPVDKSKVLAAISGKLQEKQRQGKVYHVDADGAIHFVSDRLAVAGPPPVVEKLLDRSPQPDTPGPLSEALKLAMQDHHLVVGLNPPAESVQELRQQLPPQLKGFEPLLDLQRGSLAATLGDDFQLAASLDYADEARAKKGRDAAQAALALGRGVIAQYKEDAKKDPKQAELIKTLAPLEKSLDNLVMEQNGTTVKLGLKTEGGIGTILAALGPLIAEQLQGAAQKSVSANNLKQLAIAMHNYESANRNFPPAVIRDQNGKPLYSWRVALLPYLGEQALYDQFRKDEPWNSPHNMKLLAKMPKVFAAPPGGAPGPASATHYQVLVSSEKTDPAKRAAFGGPQPLRIADFRDGTANTLLIVEAAVAVPWTQPADVSYEPDRPLPRLGGISGDVIYAAFADGSVRPLNKTIPEEILRALTTPAGGEAVPKEF